MKEHYKSHNEKTHEIISDPIYMKQNKFSYEKLFPFCRPVVFIAQPVPQGQKSPNSIRI